MAALPGFQVGAFQSTAFQQGAVPSTMMTRVYRFLEDHVVGQFYIPAGTIATTAIGDVLPNQPPWKPTPNVDPLNTFAVNDFYAAGPQYPGLFRTQFAFQPVNPPVTYWIQIAPDIWALTGLGSNRSTYPPKGGL
jgi:hypothetical protein